MTDFIVYRLKKAGWISGHQFQSGRGYFLEWTPEGRQRAVLLQELIIRHNLNAGSRALKFTSGVLETSPTWEGKTVPSTESDFWRLCLTELGLGAEENSLATFARIIATHITISETTESAD